MRTVLCIDGPLRGKNQEISDGATSFKYLRDIHATQGTYHIHRFVIFGRQLWLASVHPTTNTWSERDALDVILTPEAKNAFSRMAMQ
jgi:hypothetical protein